MTSPYDQIRADVAAAEAADQAKDAQLAAAAQQHQSDQQTIAAKDAQITELENELHPTPPKIRWGVDATSKDQHDGAVPIFGPVVDAWRFYRGYNKDGSPEAATYPDRYTIGPDETYVWSQKNKTLSVDGFVAVYKAHPAGKPLFVIPWHEYADDIEKGHLTQDQVNALYRNARAAQRQVGRSDIKIVACMMGFDWTSPKRDIEKLLPPEDTYDIITSDTYFNGGPGQIGRDISTARKQFTAQIATAAKHGKTWGVTETGVGKGLTGAARNKALHDLAALIKELLLSQPIVDPDGLLGLYFATQEVSTWGLSLTDGSAAAWKAGQAA